MKQNPSSETFSPSENRSGSVSELCGLAHLQAVFQSAMLGCFLGKGLKASEIQMKWTVRCALNTDFCSKNKYWVWNELENWNTVFSFALIMAFCLLFRSRVMLDPQKCWRKADRSPQESVVTSVHRNWAFLSSSTLPSYFASYDWD